MMSTCAACTTSWTGVAVAHCGSCHQTFAGPGLFDRHRQQYGERGRCVDPAEVRGRDGYRILFLRDGMWRGPEADDEKLTALRGRR